MTRRARTAWSFLPLKSRRSLLGGFGCCFLSPLHGRIVGLFSFQGMQRFLARVDPEDENRVRFLCFALRQSSRASVSSLPCNSSAPVFLCTPAVRGRVPADATAPGRLALANPGQCRRVLRGGTRFVRAAASGLDLVGWLAVRVSAPASGPLCPPCDILSQQCRGEPTGTLFVHTVFSARRRALPFCERSPARRHARQENDGALCAVEPAQRQM